MLEKESFFLFGLYLESRNLFTFDELPTVRYIWIVILMKEVVIYYTISIGVYVLCFKLVF